MALTEKDIALIQELNTAAEEYIAITKQYQKYLKVEDIPHLEKMQKTLNANIVAIKEEMHYPQHTISINSEDAPPTIDLGNLSEEELKEYNQKIEDLSNNELFKIYYGSLSKSKNNFIIKSGAGDGGSGSFNPKTKEVHAVDNVFVLSQELFHAYQYDLGVYSKEDYSVMETEGDIVSFAIALSVGSAAIGEDWGDVVANFTDDNFMFDERVFTKAFDEAFNKAVDAKIAFYKKREEEYDASAPLTYVQKNSGVGALALKRMVMDMKASREKNDGEEFEELIKIRK